MDAIKDAINRAPTITKPEFDFPTFGAVENGVMALNWANLSLCPTTFTV